MAGNVEALARGDASRATLVGSKYLQLFLNAIDNIRGVIEFPADFDHLNDNDEEHKRFRYAAADALLLIFHHSLTVLCV